MSASARLLGWLPELNRPELTAALDDGSLSRLAYELLVCSTVLEGNPALTGEQGGLLEENRHLWSSSKRHNELMSLIQTGGADAAAATKLHEQLGAGAGPRMQPLRHRWELVKAVRPTRELLADPHDKFVNWLRRQLLFLGSALLLHVVGGAQFSVAASSAPPDAKEALLPGDGPVR